MSYLLLVNLARTTRVGEFDVRNALTAADLSKRSAHFFLTVLAVQSLG